MTTYAKLTVAAEDVQIGDWIGEPIIDWTGDKSGPAQVTHVRVGPASDAIGAPIGYVKIDSVWIDGIRDDGTLRLHDRPIFSLPGEPVEVSRPIAPALWETPKS